MQVCWNATGRQTKLQDAGEWWSCCSPRTMSRGHRISRSSLRHSRAEQISLRTSEVQWTPKLFGAVPVKATNITHRIHGAAIYGNIYHQYTPNVSIYTSTMDPMGDYTKTSHQWLLEVLVLGIPSKESGDFSLPHLSTGKSSQSLTVFG